jgi:hypothetical protein
MSGREICVQVFGHMCEGDYSSFRDPAVSQNSGEAAGGDRHRDSYLLRIHIEITRGWVGDGKSNRVCCNRDWKLT